jgi:hypothetical protein
VRVGLVTDGAVDALCAAAATALTSLATVDVNKCTIGASGYIFHFIVSKNVISSKIFFKCK